jgi:uncharacterized protein
MASDLDGEILTLKPRSRYLKTILCCTCVMLMTHSLEAKVDDTPWGIDADLAQNKIEINAAKPTAGLDSIILFHQQVISEADGPRSHFYPSSSSYMLQGIRKHGLLNGYLSGCDRLMRENSDEWVYSAYRTKDGHYLKFDPIP